LSIKSTSTNATFFLLNAIFFICLLIIRQQGTDQSVMKIRQVNPFVFLRNPWKPYSPRIEMNYFEIILPIELFICSVTVWLLLCGSRLNNKINITSLMYVPQILTFLPLFRSSEMGRL
jgi:hypothetical protein